MNPKALSGADLARCFGVDRSMVTRWKKAGMPENKGVFNLPECIKWRMERETEALAPKSTTPEGEKWLTAFRRERARMARLERLHRQGELITKKDVIDAWVWRVSNLRAGLLSWQSRLPPVLEGKCAVDLRLALRDAVHELLEAFQRNGQFTPKTEQEDTHAEQDS